MAGHCDPSRDAMRFSVGFRWTLEVMGENPEIFRIELQCVQDVFLFHPGWKRHHFAASCHWFLGLFMFVLQLFPGTFSGREGPEPSPKRPRPP